MSPGMSSLCTADSMVTRSPGRDYGKHAGSPGSELNGALTLKHFHRKKSLVFANIPAASFEEVSLQGGSHGWLQTTSYAG